MDTINNGTYDNDPSAEAIRVSFEKTKDNFSEIESEWIYRVGERISAHSVVVSDDADLYAHDSQVLAVNYSTKELVLIAYQCDKVTKNEYQTTQHYRLIIYNAQTRTIEDSIEVAKGNTEYNGITLADAGIGKPRMFDLGTGYIRLTFNCSDNVYYRDLSLSDYTLGNVAVFQVRIRNAANDGWDASPVDLTVANLSTHCERCGGGAIPSAAPTYTLIPHVAGMDSIQQVGSDYYFSCEAYYGNSGDYGIAFLMSSTDLSDWVVYPPVYLDTTTYTNNKTSESAFVYIDDKWHVISRANNYLYASSEDGGLTWSSQAASGLINPNSGSKTSAAYVNIQTGAATYRPIAFFAYNKDTLIYKSLYGRTTMGLSYTADMVNFTDIAIMVNYRTNHYPSICYHNGLIYMTYTTTMGATNTDRNTVMLAVFNPYKQLMI